MNLVRATCSTLHRHATRMFAILRAIWRMKAPDSENGPPLQKLPVEILQSIRDLLPLSSAACFTISSRHFLRILGNKTLHSLGEKGHAWEKKCFLVSLERDLPEWQLCHPCLVFHPVDRSNGSKSSWCYDDEPECAQVSGIVRITDLFIVRFQHAQLIMNNYRFGLPYISDLEMLCQHYELRRSDSYVESTITASIENGGLVVFIISRLQLLKGWKKSLIDRRLPIVCRHNAICFLFPDQTLTETLFCRRNHRERTPCSE